MKMKNKMLLGALIALVSVAAGANLVSAPDDGETSFYRGGGIPGSGGDVAMTGA